MNKRRRKELQEMFDALTEIVEKLEVLKEDEEATLENIPENLQGTEHYEQCELAIDTMQEAIESLSSACDGIEEIVNA